MDVNYAYHGQRRPRWSLDELSTELLVLIAEKVRDLDTASVTTFRLLSQRFDTIATPVQYRYIELNDKLVGPLGAYQFPRALSNIFAHTRNVLAGSNLDPNGTRAVLDRMERLETVRWRYQGRESVCQDFTFLPSDVLPTERPVNLEVEELPLRDFTSGFVPDTYLRAIPTSRLVSLKLAKPVPPLTTRLSSLRTLVTSSTRLSTFHYIDRGQGTSFTFSPGERMPPLNHLSLTSYDWNHDHRTVQDHWNFSQLETLELNSVPLHPFLTSIQGIPLRNLRELRLSDYSAHLPDHRTEATVLLHRLIRDSLTNLRVLSITVNTPLFPLDALVPHASTLQELRLRDHVGFRDDDTQCPTLWPSHVLALSRLLIHLHKLELDMDVRLCNAADFMGAVCRFRKLDEVVLNVQTVLRPLEESYGNVDRDLDVAMGNFGFLRGERERLRAGVWTSTSQNMSTSMGKGAIGMGMATTMGGYDSFGAGAVSQVRYAVHGASGTPFGPSMDDLAHNMLSSSSANGNTNGQTINYSNYFTTNPGSAELSPMHGIILAGSKARKTPDPYRSQQCLPGTIYPSTSACSVAPWRSITLNVGGWKKVMVRRLGDGWRRHNENGVYAERCFVMERLPCGQYGVREERCAEMGEASRYSSNIGGNAQIRCV